MGAGASLIGDGNTEDRCSCDNIVGPFNGPAPSRHEECKSDKPTNTPENSPDTVASRKISSLASDTKSTPRFINFELFQSHGSFPRYPNNWNLATNINDIRRNKSLIVYISHNWLRGHSEAEGWDGTTHPDNESNNLYYLCVNGIEKILQLLAPRVKKCFIWVDYSCLNQDQNPAEELSTQLHRVMEFCDILFTPVYDESDTRWHDDSLINNMFTDYKATEWWDGKQAYLNQAWNRLEMLYGANIPLLGDITTTKQIPVARHTLFRHGLSYHVCHNRRPHFIYGTQEIVRRRMPQILPPLQRTNYPLCDPLSGHVHNEADWPFITELFQGIVPFYSSLTPGYYGPRNYWNQKHGTGTEYMLDGFHYKGEYKNDKRHGKGKLAFPSGDYYDGMWRNNLMHGKGVYYFSDGDKYTGDFYNNLIHGRGKYQHNDGLVYEGDFKNALRHGQGKFVSPNSYTYNGEFKNNKNTGNGKFIKMNRNITVPKPPQSELDYVLGILPENC